MRKIIKILLDFVWFLAKAALIVKSFFVALFKLIAKPFWAVLRFFYYILILPLYRLYLLLGKKLGLSKSKQDKWLSTILINKKLVHFLFAGLVVLMACLNIFQTQRNVSSEEIVGRTLLAKVVTGEVAQADQLIEVYQSPAPLPAAATSSYWAHGAYLRPPLAIDYDQGTDETNNNYAAEPQGQAPSRTESISYTVKSGDSIGSIARYFGISVNTILWENNLTAKSYIKPGDSLTILPTTGVTHTIARGDTLAAVAQKYGVSASDILAYNNLNNANQIRMGEKLLIPGAKKLVDRAVAGNYTKPGQSRSLVSIITSARGSAAITGGKLNWPTHGTITQYYSWAHTGVDIANHIGTPVYAAEAGTVVEAAWNSGGYGYNIVIDHGNGLKTRYAHLSKFVVSVGDDVDRGQNIALMGSTGNSTGPHLHFEVMIYGKHYNPLGYLY